MTGGCAIPQEKRSAKELLVTVNGAEKNPQGKIVKKKEHTAQLDDECDDYITSVSLTDCARLSRFVNTPHSLQHHPRLDLSPPDEPPVFFHSSRKRDLFPFFRAHRRRELQLGEVALHRDDPRTGAHAPDVQHQNLGFGELRDLALLFAALCPDTKQPEIVKINVSLVWAISRRNVVSGKYVPAQQKEVNLEFREHLRELAD